jgi:hypothetical protein
MPTDNNQKSNILAADPLTPPVSNVPANDPATSFAPPPADTTDPFTGNLAAAPINPSTSFDNSSVLTPSVSPVVSDSLAGSAPPAGGSTIPDTAHVPEKYGGKKVIATIFGIMLLVGAVATGVYLAQRVQNPNEQAESGSECEQSIDCDLVDNAPNSGTRTVGRNIIYVDITDQEYHRYYPGNNDDGCRRVNISGKTVTWERYGSGSDCKDVSNVQIWMGDVTSTFTPSPTPIATLTPTTPPGQTATITPTKSATNTVTPTTTAVISASCSEVKAYNANGALLTPAQLAQLKPGDEVRFAVIGQTSGGSFSKARFTVNSATPVESATKNTAEEYYIDYTIPAGTATFNVKGEVFHSTLGWI